MTSKIFRRGELAELVAEVMARGGHLEITAVGASMEPVIRAGDKLVLGPVHATEPRPGQVALVQLGGRLLAHRVVEASATGIVTRGDATGVDDAPVPRAEVLAIVRSVHTPLWRRVRRLLPL